MGEHELTIGKDVDLKAEQEKTLQTPVMKANWLLRLLYLSADLLYGRGRTLPKFLVIEILARYPYWAWENGSYHRLTRKYGRQRPVGKDDVEVALRHIDLGRRSQDNEQCHMLLIRDFMRQKGIQLGFLRGCFFPRLQVFGYFYLTRMLYRLRPAWTFSMNARFESHAEHEYMRMVQEHPEWENEPADSDYFEYYPRQKSLADLFRRIGLDERDHMLESMAEYERLTGRPL